jgi:hypothetical protein
MKLHSAPTFFALLLLSSSTHLALAQNLPDLMPVAERVNAHVVYRTFAADDCTVREGCIVSGTRRLLVFTTVTRNIGTADLVLGDPATNSAFYFDACHGHYHYNGFAEYRLRHSDGTLAVLGRKIGFCMEDIEQWDPNAGGRRYDCTYQGIQMGWADVYSEDTPCNWIDITGLAGGDYFLELEMNPAHTLPESDFGNNMVSLPVSFSDDCGAAPVNDNFSAAQQITRSPISYRTYNACASKEPGEPNHAGNAGGHSLWYRGTAVANGIIHVTTDGSDFDTLLAVYTGNSVNALSLVASNDDANASANIRTSRLSFNAVAGTEYRIVVDGYDGTAGMVVLTIDPPVNDYFTNCTVLNGSSGHTTGYNIGATKEQDEPDHSGNIGGHSVWYCWTAPVTQPATFDTIGSDFDTTLGVYTGNAVNDLTLVASDNDNGGNYTSRLGFEAVAGTTYHIAVDGVSGISGHLALNWGVLPRLTIQKISATSVRLTLSASQGTYDLQASSDLTQWSRLATYTMTGTSQQYIDGNAGSAPHRFYQVVIPH